MGIDVLWPNPADKFYICTVGSRPTALQEGLIIYETDTDCFRVYDGTNWRIIGGPGAKGNETVYGNSIGTNDYGGATFTNIILNKTLTPPAGAQNVRFTVNIGARPITAERNWDAQIKWAGAVPATAPAFTGITLTPNNMHPLMWKFTVSLGGVWVPQALQLEMRQISGTSGAVRQSASSYAIEWEWD